jgi:two-component system CheB/CheR fusion protein
MGGEIRAQSEHGKGSCFSFTAEFGLVEGNEEAVAAPPAVAPAGCTCSLRILLAEDNPVNRFLAQDLLERQGHSVCVARNGREALEALGREPFDVVLMDLQMPEMSGMEAARRIRKGQVPGVPADFPIVAVTARAFRGDREVYMEAGLDDYVTKPIDPGRLNEVLATIATRCGRGPQSEEPEVSDPTA